MQPTRPRTWLSAKSPALCYQKGIDCTISDVEMAMSLENFRQTILEPAMAQLAAQIEYDTLAGVYTKVPNYVGTVSSQIDFKKFQQCGQVLPKTSLRSIATASWA